jgi:monoamine oxidase
MGFNAADHAKKLESWSDQQIVASAMHALKRIFGEAIPSPVDHQITRWAMDPFSWGAYSYNPVGSVPKMRSNLAAPLGNVLFFAGEATEQRYFSTAHGAYLSGLRASKEVRRS